MKYIILSCAIVIILLFLKLGMGHEKKKILLRFEGRESMSMQGFYSEFYANSGIPFVVIEELLLHVASELCLPVEKLRPSDRFDSEMAPERGWNWDSGAGMLSVEIQNLAREKNVQVDLRKIVTLDDYLRIAAPLWRIVDKF
jgi:hypothetical protein